MKTENQTKKNTKNSELRQKLSRMDTAKMTPQQIKEATGYKATRNALIKFLHQEAIPFRDPRTGLKPRPGGTRDKLSGIDTSNMTINQIHTFLEGKVKVQSLRMICLYYGIPYKKEANRV
ncbi:hypothetical protein LGN04_02125 [Burkholderia multivorans]|uniref:hypothetical protein n=1 Tax=Burkholderia multivorans TaxID=87883 RepID=UPI001C2489B5|nr:hypothetical protein [Burkholderia multivorans]MBU9434157.1 hypothetical protein [Burkholderia multivorans]MCA8452715.1 hypothetical protein [Burkholderia multivorans]MDN7873659.1 hypothetical protein [Burkholderia multivorans]